MQLNRNSAKQQLSNQPALSNQAAKTDACAANPRSVIEGREHSSVEALLSGSRVVAKEQLKLQLSGNSLVASSQLIESSRHLLEQSQRLIVKAENALIFSRASRTKPN